ncbi:hypothetical protein FS749_004137 [Ceratobasidium sp. UAMH 11750]|nr:hypothetical protein FS749_004137 [Ceratobasidium sp. UAMH 11750]
MRGKIGDIFDRLWPHIVFFDILHQGHPQYAMATLINWLKTDRRMYHADSNTWLGGPAGCQWIVVILFHIVRALTNLDRKSRVPHEIAKHYSAESHKMHWHSVRSAIIWLNAELRASCETLRNTFSDRADVWKAHVLAAYHGGAASRAGAVVDSVPLVRGETFAVPSDDADLHACYEAVQQMMSNGGLAGQQQIASPEDSHENITIPEMNSTLSSERSQARSESRASDADHFNALANQTLQLLTQPISHAGQL